jgi:hypothetical protein
MYSGLAQLKVGTFGGMNVVPIISFAVVHNFCDLCNGMPPFPLPDVPYTCVQLKAWSPGY